MLCPFCGGNGRFFRLNNDKREWITCAPCTGRGVTQNGIIGPSFIFIHRWKNKALAKLNEEIQRRFF